MPSIANGGRSVGIGGSLILAIGTGIFWIEYQNTVNGKGLPACPAAFACVLQGDPLFQTRDGTMTYGSEWCSENLYPAIPTQEELAAAAAQSSLRTSSAAANVAAGAGSVCGTRNVSDVSMFSDPTKRTGTCWPCRAATGDWDFQLFTSGDSIVDPGSSAQVQLQAILSPRSSRAGPIAFTARAFTASDAFENATEDVFIEDRIESFGPSFTQSVCRPDCLTALTFRPNFDTPPGRYTIVVTAETPDTGVPSYEDLPASLNPHQTTFSLTVTDVVPQRTSSSETSNNNAESQPTDDNESNVDSTQEL